MKLRIAHADDAAAIQAIYAPVVRETATSFEYEAPSADDMASRIARTLERYPWLVAEIDGDVAGYAYGGAHRMRTAYQWSVETSVYVSPAFRKRGVGVAVNAALLDVLRAQGFANAFGGITLPNAASVALHERLGYVRIGVYRGIGFKLGRWHDVGWWQRRLIEDDAAPREPIAIGDVDIDAVLK